VTIEADALGRPRRVGGQLVDYDPLTSLPSRIGEVRVVNLPGLAWRSDDGAWGRSRPAMPEGLTVGTLTFLGARVLDQASSQFLTPDPLLTVPGSNGAASAYTYAWNDPVNFVDPTGMRPISQQEWNAIREREEQGRLGQAWQAIQDDPWGSLAAGAVIVTGAVLCFTPLAPVGVGILIGAGVSAGTGFVTGTLDPRLVALSGVLGGITGGAGAADLIATRSIALGVGMGAVGDFGTQLVQGGPIDWQSVAVNGVVGGLTGGIGYRMGANPSTTATRAALVGGATEGGGSVVRLALTGDHSVDLGRVAFDAAGGAGSSVANDRFSPNPPVAPREPLQLPAPPQPLALPPGPGPETVTVYRRTDHVAELQIQQETGLILSDAARRAYVGTGGDLDMAHSYSASAHQHGVRVWGSENDFGGKRGVTFRADVPRDSLIAQTLPTSNAAELLAPHSIRMDSVGD
jgi:RHS repeat-associated protein